MKHTLGQRAVTQRIDEMMRWGRYWQLSPGCNGVSFSEIHTPADAAQARKFCRVFWKGQMFADATESDILAVADALRFRNQVAA